MIPLPLTPKVVERKGNSALIEIEALYPGYGITIGNALRRVLLSSLEGAAVTQVNIKGVPHEFSTISGISEDAIALVINIRQLRFSIVGDEPQTCVLKAKGEKEVTGADLELPSQLTLANPGAHIANLTSKTAKLEMEIKVEKGTGYLSKESRMGKEKLEIGAIMIDAMFTPVKKMGFKTQNMRVGDRTDFDKVLFDIETDGTITPEAAFSRASEILVNHFEMFKNAFTA
ncbi:MAG: DNA-directed RNA polymerase subunit alpha [Minisyncoccales bacterium]|jgi:DNA-directed RNA polymerase subunit alpha|nr:DNA-directed RNA polymerase subunit alpha [Candidatus Pacearchaeota archaeon]